MSKLHHFKQTEKPEPAYGAAAKRYSAERELGRRVVEILRRAAPENWMDDVGFEEIAAELFPEIQGAALSLGLLPEPGVKP